MLVITLPLAWMLKFGVNSSRYRAQFANQVLPIPSVLPLEGWSSSLQQFPPFNYGCLDTHLVTHSKTIAENQRSAAAATFGAGAMKHKEGGYLLFPDDHVQMVGFPPGFATDRHHHLYQECLERR